MTIFPSGVGAIATVAIFVSLLIAHQRALPLTLALVFRLIATGVLLYVALQFGYRSFESVERLINRDIDSAFKVLGAVLAGLLVVLISFGKPLRDRSQSSTANPFEAVILSAVAIGLCNIAEGWAVQQPLHGYELFASHSMAAVAFRNILKGFIIVGGIVFDTNQHPTAGDVGDYRRRAAALGARLSQILNQPYIIAFVGSLATFSALYVIRECIPIGFATRPAIAFATIAFGLVIGLITSTPLQILPVVGPLVVERVITQAVPHVVKPEAEPEPVKLTIRDGKFIPATLTVPANATLIITNDSKDVVTLEGANILMGDVPIGPNSTRGARMIGEAGGKYTIIMEEDLSITLPVTVTGDEKLEGGPANSVDVVQVARAIGRQPLIPVDTRPPTYAAYTSFNIVEGGMREAVLKELFEISKAVTAQKLPPDLSQYFSNSSWRRLRPSVAMVYGLGPPAYDTARFGDKVAASKPADLHPIAYGNHLKFNAAAEQKDLLVRVTSDSSWFNQQICRYVWRKLGERINSTTFDFGYSNPNGRSTLLGGFFDGTGNPIDDDREKAVFLVDDHSGGTYLTWFKINVDVDRFAAHTLDEQQELIGRYHDSGAILPQKERNSHRAKAEGDTTRNILRQPAVYDYGLNGGQGLIFVSLQASLTNQFEGILQGFMMNPDAPKPGAGKDKFMDYMKFLSGGYYFIPPIPNVADGYPGMP